MLGSVGRGEGAENLPKKCDSIFEQPLTNWFFFKILSDTGGMSFNQQFFLFFFTAFI